MYESTTMYRRAQLNDNNELRYQPCCLYKSSHNILISFATYAADYTIRLRKLVTSVCFGLPYTNVCLHVCESR